MNGITKQESEIGCNKVGYNIAICLLFSVFSFLFVSCDKDNSSAEATHLTFEGYMDPNNQLRSNWTDPKLTGSLSFDWDYTTAQAEDNGMVMAVSDHNLVGSDANRYHTYANIKQHPSYADTGSAKWAVFETIEKYSLGSNYDGHQVLAVMPIYNANGSTVVSSKEKFKAEMPMPATFTHTESGNCDCLNDYVYMYASSVIENGTATLNFKHIPHILRIVVTNMLSTDVNIHSVKLRFVDDEGNYHPVASQKAVLTWSEEQQTAEPIMSGSYDTIESTLDTSLSYGDNAVLYAAVLPLADNDAFMGKTFQVFVETRNPDKTYLVWEYSGENWGKIFGDVYNWIGGTTTLRMRIEEESN